MKFNVRTICMIAMLTAVTSVLSIMQIPTPWGVPFTLQTAAVALSGYVLGEKYGTISTILYVLLGTIGVPVFAGMSAGPGVLFGATGGYIFGFIFMNTYEERGCRNCMAGRIFCTWTCCLPYPWNYSAEICCQDDMGKRSTRRICAIPC